jgi:aryl-alcohol dehydrogenase-like predicted oxidoreductase
MRAAAADLIPGSATRAGTESYAASVGASCAAGHYSDFLNQHLKLSSIGLGTLRAMDSAVVELALAGGINVIDTAVHYRTLEAIGEGIRSSGVPREAIFVAVKGFISLDSTWEIDHARAALGLATLDAFIVDQPERHVAALGKEAMHQGLRGAFDALQLAVEKGRIRSYGIASFDSLRVETDAAQFQSIAALKGLAGTGLRILQLPFNPAMTEGLTRFSQATGKGNVASTLQAARQLGIYCITSHALGKGRFATDDPLADRVPGLANPAQRALQFARSTPGVGTALVGVSSAAHLDDALVVARTAPLGKEDYLRLYERA